LVAASRCPLPWGPEELARHCLTFFRDADAVLASVPHRTAALGLEAIPGIDGYLGVLSVQEVPFALRAELAYAHVDLYKSAFPDKFWNEAFMWWERLAGASYEDGPRVGDDEEICAVLWKAIEEILHGSLTEDRQMCALHGVAEIGVWRIKDVPGCIVPRHMPSAVERFLASPVPKTRRIIEYAREVAAGNAQ
jgi:hypothetical protein